MTENYIQVGDQHDGQQHRDELCIVCRDIDLRQYLFQDLCPGTVKLGEFQDIMKRKHCPLCRVIMRALYVNSEDYWKEGIYPVESCYLGRYDKLLRPSILEVWFTSDSTTLPKGIYGYNTTLGEIILVSNGTQGLENTPINPGRIVGPSVDMAVLRGWLSNCENRHGEKCEGTRTLVPPGITDSQLLIDVNKGCLVKAEANSRYMALSYVWGKVTILQTLTTNLLRLQQNGALTDLSDQIPTVIKNAMQVVSDFGEKYLWVDALCIVQDGPEKQTQISQMDKIYGRATLTIVALAGEDANVGLPGISTISRTVNECSETIHGMCLAAKSPELFRLLGASRWESRAWTFQERILSRRLLYFTEAQTYFQCRLCVCYEDIYGEHSKSSRTSSGAVNPLDREVWATDAAYSPAFNIYEGLVKSYCGRQLSYQSDILSAFSGIMSALQERHGWKFTSALPEQIFGLALLWRPMTSSRPRFRCKLDEAGSSFDKFPSWCWSAWEGDIYWDPWRTNSYAANDIRFKTEVENFEVKDETGWRKINPNIELENFTLKDQPLTTSKPLLSLREEVTMRDHGIPEGSLPDVPVIRFWAEAIELGSLYVSFEKKLPEDSSYTVSSMSWIETFNKMWIYDIENHHCGTLSGREPSQDNLSDDISKHELILLSRCYQDVVTDADIETSLDRLPTEYPQSQEYYQAAFDTSRYVPTMDWALNVMLVERREGYYIRMAVGQIHSDAWEKAGPCKKLVRLA
ncbi:hypothetical protein V491_02032 [Pseudogymnoascus sp. VKM F-3775]|nr:hypothetical protein V491_02032 [Pseudogymnoascus sp. VKM F-3775]